VDAVTDWREHFRARPWTFLGVAFGGGVVLAAALGNATPLGSTGTGPQPIAPPARHAGTGIADEVWRNAKIALVALAIEHLKEFIEELIPGFGEHYRRAEESGAARAGFSRSPVRD
jgi:hypothetical protein